ncbi:extracellular matrix protein 1-like [Rhinoraja longicauda]
MFRTVFLVCCFSLPTLGQDDVTRGISVEQRALPVVGSLTAGDGATLQTRAELAKRGAVFAFPRECPDARNIGTICQYVGQRKTETPDWSSHNRRQLRYQADALQRMEDAYAKCCGGDNVWTRLHCALDGWMSSLDQYCDEEFSIKTLRHKCCMLWGEKRYHCFTVAAPSGSYVP